jgi:hypothetical protein
MWTPHNEGHWVAMRAEVSDVVLSDYERFSNNTVLVPKETAGAAYRLIPLSLDPPAHALSAICSTTIWGPSRSSRWSSRSST